MKMKKIVLIVIFFLLATFLSTRDSLGFKEGEKVQCTKKSYEYKQEWSNGVDPFVKGYKRTDNFFPAETRFFFVKSENKDNICQVKHLADERYYYIKETNLKKAEEAPGNSLLEASNRFYEQYKNKTVGDFKQMNVDQLKSLQEECSLAINSTADEATKLKLRAILNKILDAAREKGMTVDENNNIQHEIPEGSNQQSGAQAWGDRVQGVQEEIDAIEEAERNSGELLDTSIYQKPILIASEESKEKSLDDMIGDAESFVNSGHTNYDEEALQYFSQTMYNILLSVGIVVAVIVGGFIGLKFMTETSAEGKAEVTKILIPYVVGCIIVFGGFAIWKLVVDILSKM